MRQVQEWEAPSPDDFRSKILFSGRPAVLRGVAINWPIVTASKDGLDRFLGMLSRNASQIPVDILRADPSEQGRFHYNPDGLSLNFLRGRASLPIFLAMLREQSALEEPYAMVAQGLRANVHVPGFSAHHPMPLVPEGTEARLWIGNASTVAAHNDPIDNVAVVVAGRRHFTLFPPTSEDDLYMGPKHPTPAGTPVSMVNVTAPDLDRHPRFAAALEAGEEAELFPGDAIFIPKDWFHNVESLERFNMLVNYWWDASPDGAGSS
jgi:hypothetical protein